MIYVIDDTIVWMAVPNTGEAWIRQALCEVEIPFKSDGVRWPCDYPSKWPYAAISTRHPALWVASLWAQRKNSGWDWQRQWWPEYELLSEFGEEKLKDWKGWLEAITYRRDWVTDYLTLFTAVTRGSAFKWPLETDLLRNVNKCFKEVGISWSITTPPLPPPENRCPLSQYDFSRIYYYNPRIYLKLGYERLPTPQQF